MRRRTGRPASRAFVVAVVLAAAFSQAPAMPPEAQSPSERRAEPAGLIDLSLEELLNLEVTSVSKKRQPLSLTAAAVHVITAEDIRRSGAMTIPEVLRMAPGVQVARIDANKWAVSARGFNGRFANKLLVLIDGRSVYTPMFSGVYWDVEEVPLEEIERIEVVRGPGAAIWGANAVNGVINIITKSAADSHGGLASAAVGGEERGYAMVRYADRLGRDASYRAYVRYFDRDGFVDSAGSDAADEWNLLRGGLRIDWQGAGGDSVAAIVNGYGGDIGSRVNAFSASPVGRSLLDIEQDASGLDALVRWERPLADDADFTIQAYFDRSEREATLYSEERDTFDLELRHRFRFGERSEMSWGVEHRVVSDNLGGSDSVLIGPARRTLKLLSGFVQGEIALVPDEVTLTLGAKYQRDRRFGKTLTELQPTVRIALLTPSGSTLWGSVSYAARTPSRSEAEATITGLVQFTPPGDPSNPFPVPLVFEIRGSPEFDSEHLTAYEAGYRSQFSNVVGLDAAVFYNDFDDLRSNPGLPLECFPGGVSTLVNPICPFLPGTTYVAVPVGFDNGIEGRAHGAELAVDWRPAAAWRLQLAHSYVDIDVTGGAEGERSLFEGSNPKHQLSLRGSIDLGEPVSLDLWLRHVDDLPARAAEAYTELDARVAWRPMPGLELALVGRNLANDEHEEFLSELGDIPLIPIERSFFGQLRWEF